MSYILTASSSIATPVSVANGGTGASTPQVSLSNILEAQPNIPPSGADPVDLERAVNEILILLQTMGAMA